jgi:hypothetical protein
LALILVLKRSLVPLLLDASSAWLSVKVSILAGVAVPSIAGLGHSFLSSGDDLELQHARSCKIDFQELLEDTFCLGLARSEDNPGLFAGEGIAVWGVRCFTIEF